MHGMRHRTVVGFVSAVEALHGPVFPERRGSEVEHGPVAGVFGLGQQAAGDVAVTLGGEYVQHRCGTEDARVEAVAFVAQGDEFFDDFLPRKKRRIAVVIGECERRLAVFGPFVRRQEVALGQPAAQRVGQLPAVLTSGRIADEFFGLRQNPAAADIHA